MEILKPEFDFERFFEVVARAPHRILFIDYDGTLAPFRVERERAFPYPGVTDALESILQDALCQVVVVTGRRIDDLIPLLGLESYPEMWGCHGWERMKTDGTRIEPELESSIVTGLAEAYSFAEEQGFADRCEKKVACLALHWRGLNPETIESIQQTVGKRWQTIAAQKNLRIYDFNGGIELRSPARDKGYTVQTVLAESPDGAAAAFLGDDRTDEDAFNALREKGLSVLVSPELRPTNAAVWLKPPNELLEFLYRWSDACRGRTWRSL
jgi:trehalose-phosphatase